MDTGEHLQYDACDIAVSSRDFWYIIIPDENPGDEKVQIRTLAVCQSDVH